jgi:hypothetical protein
MTPVMGIFTGVFVLVLLVLEYKSANGALFDYTAFVYLTIVVELHS